MARVLGMVRLPLVWVGAVLLVSWILDPSRSSEWAFWWHQNAGDPSSSGV